MGRVLNQTVAALLVTAPLVVVGGLGASQLQPGGNSNRYESRYGEPEERSLDENPASWPRGQAIRTVGRLNRSAQSLQGQSGGERPRASSRIYSLQGESSLYSLVLNPVPEIADRVAMDVPTWLGREVEVVGVFETSSAVTIGSGQGESQPFNVWSMLVLEEPEDDGFDAPRSGLDALVMDTEAAAGRKVVVTGDFRGGNLLEDLPNDSRRHKDDWVLSDGTFSIWVTGKKPEGEGFSFGLRSRSDLRWELAVQGDVEIHDGYVYLRAEKVRLVGPAKDEPE